ncbi:carboxypeptidase-like regulatory domain-containing protein [Emticicia sp. 21SJ11W-3]|uniref:carboxypeptidase-like regulatory domain-containing protein n=1 Tax=Emticicia sp. 21SJ11W-3 TaxID=2916755 RepID=UPI0020A197FA|nr:carboxypeptidase-like regulatory domain-containing protein [Emticicia sp. 21SJ11W-3]UTA67612.1 carboxypeptidase-like regulatory domain-containing protein [Emticicia sp. 21SJ11W-3]
MMPSFQLNVDNPCHERWESFLPTSTGGFCASCAKNVIDFSQMSESQVVAFFRDRQASADNVCGRFRDDQLKKNYRIEDWFPEWSEGGRYDSIEIPLMILSNQQSSGFIKLPHMKHTKLIRNVAAAIMTFFCIEDGIAQNRLISGRVVDADTGDSLSHVSITVKGTKRGVISDLNGRYQISASESDTLIFSFIGYASEKRPVIESSEVLMYATMTVLSGAVSVKGIAPERHNMSTGGISISKSYCSSEKTLPLPKFASNATVWGNAVQNGELTLVPQLSASPDSAGTSYERSVHEQWFQQNGFQEVQSVQIYDNSGRVFTESFSKVSDGMIRVDVRHVPRGSYIVRIVYRNERSIAEHEVSTVRIIIER